ncbi:histone-lysine N-methyltransferase SETMAR [Trichonephila clavipes]|nr:histone-lysine N-methyltransferase SETMAR [Trichonephila clavipes]
MLHQEFVPEGQTVNTNFYEPILKGLLLRIQRVHPQLYRTDKWTILYGEANPCTVIHVRKFLNQHRVNAIVHSPHSPALVPAVLFLFSRIKGILKGSRFTGIQDI